MSQNNQRHCFTEINLKWEFIMLNQFLAAFVFLFKEIKESVDILKTF